jgi:hypothetical protein
MLVRALIYRITTDDVVGGSRVWTPDHRGVYEPAIEVALSYVG